MCALMYTLGSSTMLVMVVHHRHPNWWADGCFLSLEACVVYLEPLSIILPQLFVALQF